MTTVGRGPLRLLAALAVCQGLFGLSRSWTGRYTEAGRSIPPCRTPAIDTSAWPRSSNDALAFSFRHPDDYREHRWARSSPGFPLPLTSYWWRQEGLVWELEFS